VCVCVESEERETRQQSQKCTKRTRKWLVDTHPEVRSCAVNFCALVSPARANGWCAGMRSGGRWIMRAHAQTLAADSFAAVLVTLGVLLLAAVVVALVCRWRYRNKDHVLLVVRALGWLVV
jgi:hypothetical protein